LKRAREETKNNKGERKKAQVEMAGGKGFEKEKTLEILLFKSQNSLGL